MFRPTCVPWSISAPPTRTYYRGNSLQVKIIKHRQEHNEIRTKTCTYFNLLIVLCHSKGKVVWTCERASHWRASAGDGEGVGVSTGERATVPKFRLDRIAVARELLWLWILRIQQETNSSQSKFVHTYLNHLKSAINSIRRVVVTVEKKNTFSHNSAVSHTFNMAWGWQLLFLVKRLFATIAQFVVGSKSEFHCSQDA